MGIINFDDGGQPWRDPAVAEKVWFSLGDGGPSFAGMALPGRL